MAVNIQPMYVLAAGGERALDQLNNVTNNLSNVNTPGFKKLLIKEMSQKIPENKGKAGDLLVFPRFEKSSVIQNQGSIKDTGRNLDFAIFGEGYFQIETPSGQFLTRNGHFSVSPDGFLVDQNGGYVLDQNKKRIPIDGTKPINVTKEGEIYQEGSIVAKLGVVQFDNIKPVGNSYYSPSGNQKEAKFSILQGHLENSNVNAIESMVELINSQRRFEMYGNLLRSLDQIEQRSNEIGKA
jgi:flagellar basal-body rod protein FlgG